MENNSFNVLANNNMSSFPLFNSKIEPSIAPIAKTRVCKIKIGNIPQ